jgi:sporulation-control protein spo0M
VLPILDLEPLDLQIDALSKSQLILAEPSILRLLEYKAEEDPNLEESFMSFFKKTLASFGIGSAKVDSILQQEVLIPGQNVSIKIHVYGGSSAQEVDNIDLKLCCRYVREIPEDNDKSHVQEGM